MGKREKRTRRKARERDMRDTLIVVRAKLREALALSRARHGGLL